MIHRQMYIVSGVTDGEAVMKAARKVVAKGEPVLVHHHSFSVSCIDLTEFGCELLSPERSNDLTTAEQ